MMGTESMPKYWRPWLVGRPAEQSRAACCLVFGGVLERLPKLKVCLAHGGGSFPYTIGRIEHGFNMRPDLVATDNPRNPREYLERFFFDSWRSEEHTSELQSLMRNSYAVFCLNKKTLTPIQTNNHSFCEYNTSDATLNQSHN